ncbi:MAG: c-type cytochrome [Sediminibacterium sp.]|nr:c-type cytochrome [Sediminibacterium sp.]
MKKYYVAIAFLAILGACGDNKTESKDAKPAATEDLSANPDYQKGIELIAKSDCLTCHKVSEKLTGPAYKDVAAKYENTDANVSLLTEKIIKGGTGVWGAIPMTPHAALSEADAKQMVKYILLLRNK